MLSDCDALSFCNDTNGAAFYLSKNTGQRPLAEAITDVGWITTRFSLIGTLGFITYTHIRFQDQFSSQKPSSMNTLALMSL